MIMCFVASNYPNSINGLVLIMQKASLVSQLQICPGLNANEIQIPYDRHQKVSSLVKSHLHTQFSQIRSSMKISNNLVKYEILIKQYLRAVLDIVLNLNVTRSVYFIS